MTRNSITCAVQMLAALALCSGCTGRQEGDMPLRPQLTAASALDGHAVGAIKGVESCAAGACHGRPFDGTQRGWQTAYGVWLQEDPHRRAVDVLYAERSVEMYRQLHPESKWNAEPPQDSEYFQFLESRCIGCHGSVNPGGSEVATAKGPRAGHEFAAAIGCESCHGPAGGWLDEHYLKSWPKPGSSPRDVLIATGFFDTKNLHTRAGVCTGCHVGPQAAGDRLYDVNHDLIAAGHPRLAFEFSAYLANYPPHWNAADDEQRHARIAGGSFHVDAWRYGQKQLARHARRQFEVQEAQATNSAIRPGPDFSNFRCADCHHALGSRANVGLTSLGGLPRPLEVLGTQGGKILFQPAWKADAASWGAVLPRDELPAHAKSLSSLIADSSGGQLDFERAVQLYLAVQALQRDLPANDRQRLELAAASTQLHDGLSDPANFGPGIDRPTQYDWPATFDRRRIEPSLAKMHAALASIASHSRTPSPP